MTTKVLEKIRVLHSQGLNDRQIAEQIGTSTGIAEYWRKKMGLKAHRRYGTVKCYVIYDGKDNVRAVGSARECAETLGIQIDSVYRLAHRAKKNGTGRVVICGAHS